MGCRAVQSGLLFSFFLLGSGVDASDLEKEQRWRDQIVDALIEGEAVDLNDGKTHFLGIHTEAEGDGSMAAIVIHGSGVHPNWPTVVYPIRTRLPAKGWQTLSIQMPVLANEAEFKDYLPILPEATPRIRAAIEFVKERGAKKVVLIAHSLGATMAAYSLASSDLPVAAFVAIGMPGRADQPAPADTLNQLRKIRLPLLDLYGSADLPEVLESAAARNKAAAANAKYRQQMVEGADHFFEGEEDLLLGAVEKFLDSL